MAVNNNHYTTFISLLELSGLKPEVAEAISMQLYCIDDTAQDVLIAFLTDELYKSLKQSKVEHNS